MNEWLIYRGAGQPHDGVDRLPEPPPWRRFDGGPPVPPPVPVDAVSTRGLGRGSAFAAHYRPTPAELELVNAALYLRRPLLVTGEPGSGKSTLAHAVAYELGLGRVLRWPVTSRTELADGLYRYDALGRLQDLQITRPHRPAGDGADETDLLASGIGRYLRLGPLGTALLPTTRPRALLVDDLDRSDIDLPGDLLGVLEEGEFDIPELERISERHPVVRVRDHDGRAVEVREGRVRCQAPPFIVLTSNGERDFPAPLLRRCVQLHLESPDEDRLAAMVRAHFGEDAAERHADVIARFLEHRPGEQRAADQLLNAIYLTRHAQDEEPGTRAHLADRLMRPLNRSTG